MTGSMSKLMPYLTEIAFGTVLVLFVLFTVVDRTFDILNARRFKRRQRVGRKGFQVGATPVLPYDGDGPGVYRVEGVLERTGTPTRFDVEARCASDARDKALERGVSPASVTKKQTNRRNAA